MVDLPENGIPLMNALLGATLAWQTPAQLADALGNELEETLDLLCNLDEIGWLEVWDCEDGPLITLSPIAAARLCVRIVEVGPGETPRWAGSGDPDPPPRRAKGVFLSVRGAELEYVVDPISLVEIDIDIDENRTEPSQEESRSNRRYSEGLRPRLLLGQGLTPWPGPTAVRNERCPACLGQLLQPFMYCLCCDRWGRDRPDAIVAKTGQANALRPRKSCQGVRKAEEPQTRAQRERTLRKSRRRKRKQDQIQEERQRKVKCSAPASAPASRHEPPPGSKAMGLGLFGPPQAAPAKSKVSRERGIRSSST